MSSRQTAAPGPAGAGDRLPAEAFDRLPEYMKKEYSETESMVSRCDRGLELDRLYIGDDGHLELAHYDCDMTPPAPFKEAFDLTFRPEEADRLCRALGIAEDIIARGGTERFVCVFRALTRYTVPLYGSLVLSGEFPELLKRHGIRAVDQAPEKERLQADSTFNYEREYS